MVKFIKINKIVIENIIQRIFMIKMIWEIYCTLMINNSKIYNKMKSNNNKLIKLQIIFCK